MPALANKQIAVTGAGGFLGRAVVSGLIAEGAKVTALQRSKHDFASLRAAGAHPVLAPLVKGPALDQALQGQDVVIHLAYDVRADADSNIKAFTALYDAAQQAGVAHFVHASSVVVYDDWPSNTVLTEDSPIGGTPAHGYRAAKIAMSDSLMRGPLPATVLEPTIIWGKGGEIWTEGPMAQLKQGGIVVPDPCGHAPLLHVDDAAHAFVLAAGLRAPGKDRFLVSGSDTPTWDALFEGYTRIVGGQVIREDLETLRNQTPAPSGPPGKPGLAAKVSKAARQIMGRKRFQKVLDHVNTLRPSNGPARPDHFRLSLFTSSPIIDTSRVQKHLGFESRVDLKEGLAQFWKQ